RHRVLIIDDDPLFRSLLTSILQDGFSVTSAADGAEGYYKALDQPPHLAIVDIRMPDWDGLRTLKAFRSHDRLARVPVMMLTSDSSRQTVMSAMQAGANDYVIKTTLSCEDFLEKVCRLLEEGRQTRETTRDADSPADPPEREGDSDSLDETVPVGADIPC